MCRRVFVLKKMFLNVSDGSAIPLDPTVKRRPQKIYAIYAIYAINMLYMLQMLYIYMAYIYIYIYIDP